MSASMISPIQLASWRATLAAATKRPWEATGMIDTQPNRMIDSPAADHLVGDTYESATPDADALAIVTAVNHFEECIAEIERLRAENAMFLASIGRLKAETRLDVERLAELNAELSSLRTRLEHVVRLETP